MITAAEFEILVEQPPYNEGLFELIDGVITEKVHSELDGFILANVATMLVTYSRRMGQGRAGIESLHRVPGDTKNARQPDISFFIDPSEPVVKRGAVPRLPDLAVEVQSELNSIKHMRNKAAFYLAHGVKMVWIVYTDVYLVDMMIDADIQLLTTENTLTGGDLLPDFSMPVAEIFA